MGSYPLPRRRRYVQVINGWTIFNGRTQLGFSLEGWQAGETRGATPDNSEEIRGMAFPEEIQGWLFSLFGTGQLESVNVQRAEGRFRVHLALAVPREDRGMVIEIVDSLCTAANVEALGHGAREEEIANIMGDDRFFTHDDALAQWLGIRIRLATQAIFDAWRSRA